jgi:hypothetical protein
MAKIIVTTRQEDKLTNRAGHHLPYDGTVWVRNMVAVTVPSVS